MSDVSEKKVEEDSLDHFSHNHPLVTSELDKKSALCSGCPRFIRRGEMIYRCREGCDKPILHEECAEMPREIKLSMHLQHTLIQKILWLCTCAVCKRGIIEIGYSCASSGKCTFQVHVGCVQNMEVLPTSIRHPSHRQQPLTLLWRSQSSYLLRRCDACGTVDKGKSYMCMVCQYLIHDSCASLSATAHFQHHAHPLSLVYQLPLEYIKYDFNCNICLGALIPRYWVYHCEICRYVVHIKCAINTTINVEDAIDQDENIIVLPLKNGVEELVASFVTNAGGVMSKIPNDDQIITGKYKFHDHQLHLVSSPSSSLHHQEEEVEGNSDDDDDYFNKSEIICDGCTMPIFPNQQKSSQHKYLSCGECTYFLHWSCFNLPPEVPSHPLHPDPHHNLTLQTCPKLEFVRCYICYNDTNGLLYECTKCDFRVDIKCASLPKTIKHKAHSRHHLKLVNKESTGDDEYGLIGCNACDKGTSGDACYECDACKIMLHTSCALLPPFVTNRGWDKHRLPLTFDASVNHPSSFCCDICEQEMNPRIWMYHCRTCDFSAHPECFPTASGEYRNIKFGQQYDVASVHHHPLAYQLLTKKLHCDVCKKRREYGCEGFQCATDKCDFFMCGYQCFYDHEAEMKAI